MMMMMIRDINLPTLYVISEIQKPPFPMKQMERCKCKENNCFWLHIDLAYREMRNGEASKKPDMRYYNSIVHLTRHWIQKQQLQSNGHNSV